MKQSSKKPKRHTDTQAGTWISLLILFLMTCFFCAHISAAVQQGCTYDTWLQQTFRHMITQPWDILHYKAAIFYFGIGWYLIFAVLSLSRQRLPVADMKGKEQGSNDFQTENETLAFLKHNTTPLFPTDHHAIMESNLLLSQNIKISYNTWLTRIGSLNTLVIGGTGEGKSRGFVKPNVYALPCDPRTKKPISFVFTDPKGELCRDTAGFLEANGYQIRVLNINEQRFSDCYNPFRYIRSADSLLIMVDSVVENANGGKAPNDPHWTNSAKSLLNSICYAVYYEFAFQDQNFTTVSELLNLCGSSDTDSNYKSDYDIWLDHLKETSPMGEQHPAIVWRRKVSAQGKEMSSIISTAQTAVRIFASKEIQRLTNVDTLAMDRIGDRPSALYIIIPTTNSTYNFLISMLYTQLFESLYYRAQNVYGGSLPHHVTFFQDEFANTGIIPDFNKKIATFRSVNISTCMIVQSPNQIDTLYDKAATDIIDNVHQIVYIGSGGLGEKSASKWMSNALGTKTIQAEQTAVHPGKNVDLFGLDGRSMDHTYTATQRLLMTQDELYRMPGDRCIVLVKGHKPFYDYKIDPDQSLNFASDQFTVKGKYGRSLKEDYLYPINDMDPSHHSRKRTADSYREGLCLAVQVDEEQRMQRRQEIEEDAKYDPAPNPPVYPELDDVEETFADKDDKQLSISSAYPETAATVESLFDEEDEERMKITGQ